MVWRIGTEEGTPGSEDQSEIREVGHCEICDTTFYASTLDELVVLLMHHDQAVHLINEENLILGES